MNPVYESIGRCIFLLGGFILLKIVGSAGRRKTAKETKPKTVNSWPPSPAREVLYSIRPNLGGPDIYSRNSVRMKFFSDGLGLPKPLLSLLFMAEEACMIICHLD